VNGDFLGFVQENNPEHTATLDMDATLVETSKSESLFGYKGFRAVRVIKHLIPSLHIYLPRQAHSLLQFPQS
jgi:hypothetical protein